MQLIIEYEDIDGLSNMNKVKASKVNRLEGKLE